MDMEVRTPLSPAQNTLSSSSSHSRSIAASLPSSSWYSVEADKEGSISVPFLHLWLPPRTAHDTHAVQPLTSAAAAAANLPTPVANTHHASTRIVKKCMPPTTATTARGCSCGTAATAALSSTTAAAAADGSTSILYEADSTSEEHHNAVYPPNHRSFPSTAAADRTGHASPVASLSGDLDASQSLPSSHVFPSHTAAPSHAGGGATVSSRCTGPHPSLSLASSSPLVSTSMAAPVQVVRQTPRGGAVAVAAQLFEVTRRCSSSGHPLDDEAARVAPAKTPAKTPSAQSMTAAAADNVACMSPDAAAAGCSARLSRPSPVNPCLHVAALHRDATKGVDLRNPCLHPRSPLHLADPTRTSTSTGDDCSSNHTSSDIASTPAVNTRDGGVRPVESVACMHLAAMVDAVVTLRSASLSHTSSSSLSLDAEELMREPEANSIADTPSPVAEQPFTPTPQKLPARSSDTRGGGAARRTQGPVTPAKEKHSPTTRRLPLRNTATATSTEAAAAPRAAPQTRKTAPSRLYVPPITEPLMSLRYRPRTREQEVEWVQLQSHLAAFVFPPPRRRAATTTALTLPADKTPAQTTRQRSPRRTVTTTGSTFHRNSKGAKGTPESSQERREGSKGARESGNGLGSSSGSHGKRSGAKAGVVCPTH